jgi:hypothetical protein
MANWLVPEDDRTFPTGAIVYESVLNV